MFIRNSKFLKIHLIVSSLYKILRVFIWFYIMKSTQNVFGNLECNNILIALLLRRVLVLNNLFLFCSPVQESHLLYKVLWTLCCHTLLHFCFDTLFLHATLFFKHFYFLKVLKKFKFFSWDKLFFLGGIIEECDIL